MLCHRLYNVEARSRERERKMSGNCFSSEKPERLGQRNESFGVREFADWDPRQSTALTRQRRETPHVCLSAVDCSNAMIRGPEFASFLSPNEHILSLS